MPSTKQQADPTPRKNPLRFWRLFQQIILRDVQKNRLRTSLTLFGIALGVAILLAINLANQTAVSHFKDSLDRISGKTNLTIASAGNGFLKDTLIRDLQWLYRRGIRLTPVIESTAILDPSEDPEARLNVHVLGVDMLADAAFRSYDWQLSKSSQSGRPEAFFSIFERDGIFIGARLANAYHLTVGSSIYLLVNDKRERFTISGVLSDKGLGGAYGGDLILMDIASAQDVFEIGAANQQDHIGKISRLDAVVPDSKLISIFSTLEKTLPSGIEASRPGRRGEQVDKMLKAYQYNLTVLSFIALLVGMFLIYNTMSITVIRRRKEIGTLRALGVSKNLVMLLFGLEGLGFGIVGSILGLGLGLIFEFGAIQAISNTVESLYIGLGIHGFSVSPFELLRAFALGVFITILGGFIPVFEATQVSPAESTRHASYESKVQRISKRLSWLGVGLLLVALWAAQQPAIDRLPLFGFLSAICIILGAAFLTPFVLNWSLWRLEPLALRYGKQEGKLALAQLRGSLGRTSVSIASLMVGIAMMVSLAVMIGSFRQTVKTWVHQTLKADIWVEPVGTGKGQPAGRVSREIYELVRYTPGVEAIDAYFEFPIQYKNKAGRTEPARVGVGQLHIAKDYGGTLKFTDGRATKEVLEQVLNNMMTNPSVLVTESFATRNDVHQNEKISLETPTGSIDLRVAGIYADYSSDLGYIILPRELYNLYYEDDSISGLAVYVEPTVSAPYLQGVLQRKLEIGHKLRVRTNKQLREEVLKIFDKTFAITYALHIIAIIVALLGVLNSLLALVLASKKDFGILKYLGASERQIKKIVFIQAGLLGLLGNISGFVVGLLLSLLLVFVINKQSFGWTIQWYLPWDFLVESFLLVFVTAILAGNFPAKIAAKTEASEVTRAE